VSHRFFVCLALCVLLLSSFAFLLPAQPAYTGTAPSSSAIIQSIKLAKSFLDKLYKVSDVPVSGGATDFMAEYCTVPITIYVRETGEWRSVGGLDRDLESVSDITTQEVSKYVYDADYWFEDSYDYDYNDLVLDVRVTHYSDGKIVAKIRPKSYDGIYTLDVYVGRTYIGTVPEADWAAWVRLDVPDTVYGVESWTRLHSMRYTVRHGSQMSELTYRAFDDHWNGYYLGRVISAYGFTKDIYDPLWGLSDYYSSKDFFNAEVMYHDKWVYEDLPKGWSDTDGGYYPYFSKVYVNPYAYADHSKEDPLLACLLALHVYDRYGSPYAEDEYGNSMLEYLRYGYWIDGKFYYPAEHYWDGRGIKYWYDYYTGIRLAVFLAAESVLGYDWGNSKSREYADQAASVALQIQLTEPYFETSDAGVLCRPQYIGGYMVAYKLGSTYVYAIPPKTLVKELIDMYEMPPETTDIIPANQETTNAIIQALRTYLYHKHGIAYPDLELIPPDF